jgi:hypothetical protein
VLDLRQYFNGRLDALRRLHRPQRQGGAPLHRGDELQLDGNEGVLDEDFTYSDGSTEKRVWRLTYLGDGRYSGTAGDVVGTAFGETRGNAFRWGYTLALPVDGRVWEVQFDDWMYLMDERVMLNKAT